MYEQRKGARDPLAGNHIDTEKTGTSRLTGNHRFGVINVLEANKERWGKVGISVWECNLLLTMPSSQQS